MSESFVDDLIIRVPNFFVNSKTGKVLDSSLLKNRKKVLANPDDWLLPLGLKRDGIFFNNVQADGVITLTFKKTAQKINYVIGGAKDTIKKQFFYQTRDGLKEQVGDFLTELNQGFNPMSQEGTDDESSQKWYPLNQYTEVLKTRLGDLDFIDDDDEYQQTQPLDKNDEWFGLAPLRYVSTLMVEQEEVDDEGCCWRWLLAKETSGSAHPFSLDVLKKIHKGGVGERWTWAKLLEVAKHYKRDLILLDLDYKPYRHYTAKDEYTEYKYIEPEKNKTKRKALVAQYANNHIYPLTPKFITSYLKRNGNFEDKATGYMANGNIIQNNKEQLSETEIRSKYKKRAKNVKNSKQMASELKHLESYMIRAKDTKFVEEYDHQDFKKQYALYVNTQDLDMVYVIIAKETNKFYPIDSHNGRITKIYEDVLDEKGNRKKAWTIQAKPDYKVIKKIEDVLKDKWGDKPPPLTLGNSVGQVGRIIFNKVNSLNIHNFKTDTLGNMFEIERPYNAIYDILDNTKKDYKDYLDGSFRKGYLPQLRRIMRANATEMPIDDYVETPESKSLKDKLMAIEEKMAKETNTTKINLLTQYHKTTSIQLDKLVDNYAKTEIPKVRELGDVCSIDINKCYSSVLENIKGGLPVYEPADNVVDYEPPIKNPNTNTLKHKVGMYYVEVEDPDTFVPFQSVETEWFSHCVVDSAQFSGAVYTIKKMYLPHPNRILQPSAGKKFVNFVYTNLEGVCLCDKPCEKKDCASKQVVNHFIGSLGGQGKEVISSKSHIVNNYPDANYYKNKGHTTFGLPMIDGGHQLYLVGKQTLVKNSQNHCIWNKCILQQAKCDLNEMYEDLISHSRECEFIEQAKIRTPDDPINDMLSKFGWHKINKIEVETSETVRQYEKYKDKFNQKGENKAIYREMITQDTIYPLRAKTDSFVLCDMGRGTLRKAISNSMNQEILDNRGNDANPWGDKRGQYRVEWYCNKEDDDRSHILEVLKSNYVEPTLKVGLCPLQEKAKKLITEKDLKQLIDNNEGLNLTGMAGTGKSYTLSKKIIPLLENKKWVLTATTHKASHNELFERLGLDGRTIDSFLRLPISAPPKDPFFSMCKDLDYLMIDESSMIRKSVFYNLCSIKRLYPKLAIILIGDHQQLDPVDNSSVVYKKMTHKTNMAKFITDYNSLHLTKNMRSSTEGVEMFNLYKDIIKGKNFYKNKTFNDMRSPRGLHISKVLTTSKTHLCWTNDTRQLVNKCYVKLAIKNKHNLVIRDESSKRIKTIWEKMKVIAYPLQTDKKKEAEYYNNQEFTVKKLHTTGERYITLECSLTGDEMIITKDQLNDFDYGYCITIHKSQGSSISDKYYLWEVNYMPNKELIYVGISRTTSKANCVIGRKEQLGELRKWLIE